jgi:hypothetical protein
MRFNNNLTWWDNQCAQVVKQTENRKKIQNRMIILYFRILMKWSIWTLSCIKPLDIMYKVKKDSKNYKIALKINSILGKIYYNSYWEEKIVGHEEFDFKNQIPYNPFKYSDKIS